MIQQLEIIPLESESKLITLEEFLDNYPDGYGRFELRNGEIITMQPTGTHEQVAGFLALKIGVHIDNYNLPLLIPRQAIIKPSGNSEYSGFNPDVIVVDLAQLKTEELWSKRSLITKGETVRLIVEVVSTNWHNDYLIKLAEYEKIGIPEYWIVDYLGLGGRRYIGNPKQPTISIYSLGEGEYLEKQFRGDDRLESLAFPELNLTVAQIINWGKI